MYGPAETIIPISLLAGCLVTHFLSPISFILVWILFVMYSLGTESLGCTIIGTRFSVSGTSFKSKSLRTTARCVCPPSTTLSPEGKMYFLTTLFSSKTVHPSSTAGFSSNFCMAIPSKTFLTP